MERDRVRRRRGEPVALLRQHVQQHGAADVLDPLQRGGQRFEVVPVHRPDVPEAQFLEQHPAVQEVLQRVLPLRQQLAGPLPDDRNLVQQPGDVLLQAVVEGGRAGRVEVAGQPPDPRADAHLVVVQNDQQIFAEARGVVERLEHDAAGQCPVADHRDAAAVLPGVHEVVPGLQSEARAHAGPGVAGDEQVVLAFLRVRVAHQPAAGAERVELREPAGQQLVGVDLVAGVPDQAVFGEVERLVQGDRQFDHAEVRREVGGPVGDDAAQPLPDLGGEPLQLGVREPVEVPRVGDAGQELVLHGGGGVGFGGDDQTDFARGR